LEGDKSRKLLSALLALLPALALVSAAGFTAHAAHTNVTIAQTDTAEQIQTAMLFGPT